MILELHWIMWFVVLIHWSIFPILQFDAPHNWLPLVLISNGVVLIATWMQLPWNKHETWAILVKPGAHAFIQTIHPGGNVMLFVVIVECFKHLMDIVELIHKCRRILVSVDDCRSDLKEA